MCTHLVAALDGGLRFGPLRALPRSAVAAQQARRPDVGHLGRFGGRIVPALQAPAGRKDTAAPWVVIGCDQTGGVDSAAGLYRRFRHLDSKRSRGYGRQR